jgi:hypothetical protein
MAETSAKRRIAEKALTPLVAAGASAAATYVAKKGPGFVENTVLPRLKEVAQGAGDVAEKLPEKARAAAGSGGELAEQLTDKARDVVGVGGGGNQETGDGGSGETLSQEELARRGEERARNRAQRRRKAKR